LSLIMKGKWQPPRAEGAWASAWENFKLD
jgi:hypothetical protein